MIVGLLQEQIIEILPLLMPHLKAMVDDDEEVEELVLGGMRGNYQFFIFDNFSTLCITRVWEDGDERVLELTHLQGNCGREGLRELDGLVQEMQKHCGAGRVECLTERKIGRLLKSVGGQHAHGDTWRR